MASTYNLTKGPQVAAGLDAVRHQELLRNITNGIVTFLGGNVLPKLELREVGHWEIYSLAVVVPADIGHGNGTISRQELYNSISEAQATPCVASDIFSFAANRLLPPLRGRYIWASEPFDVFGASTLYAFEQTDDTIAISHVAGDADRRFDTRVPWLFHQQ